MTIVNIRRAIGPLLRPCRCSAPNEREIKSCRNELKIIPFWILVHCTACLHHQWVWSEVCVHGSSAVCVSDCKMRNNACIAGWEGTHHHDNTGRSRMYGIKKMDATFCLQCGDKNTHWSNFCMDEIKQAHKKGTRTTAWHIHIHVLFLQHIPDEHTHFC